MGVVELADAEVRIVLKGHTDQTGDGVLRRFAQGISTLGGRRGSRSKADNFARRWFRLSRLLTGDLAHHIRKSVDVLDEEGVPLALDDAKP